MSARPSRVAGATRRALALVAALLLATAGVLQIAHGAAAERAREAVATCEGGHVTPGLHDGAPARAHHDDSHCAQCQAFAHARVFQKPPALVLPATTGIILLALAPEVASCGAPVVLAHPPRAPPAATRLPA